MTAQPEKPLVHRTPIQVRFGDTDMMGHLNNVSLVQYSETGRLDFLGTLGFTAGDGILAHVAIDFRRQVHVTDSVRVETCVAKIGRTSFTVAQVIVANDQVSADVVSVMVMFDYASQHPVALSAEMRAGLERYQATEADT